MLDDSQSKLLCQMHQVCGLSFTSHETLMHIIRITVPEFSNFYRTVQVRVDITVDGKMDEISGEGNGESNVTFVVIAEI